MFSKKRTVKPKRYNTRFARNTKQAPRWGTRQRYEHALTAVSITSVGAVELSFFEIRKSVYFARARNGSARNHSWFSRKRVRVVHR
jgi:hypothetical protein